MLPSTLARIPFLSSGISLRPLLACEITPSGVLAARPEDASLIAHFASFAGETITPSTATPNILDRAAVVSALRTAVHSVIERVGRSNRMQGPRALTVIIPDAAVRVLLVDFDTLPSKRTEALPILRFRLRKLISFDVEDASISYQVLSQTSDMVRVLVTAIPRPVLTEYEDVVREAGFHPGVVLPSTLAASTLLGVEPALVVNRSGDTLTTAILRGEELLLHRALDFENEGAPQPEGRTLPSGAAATLLPSAALSLEALRAEDIRQTVSVALAYYEDTLASSPETLFYIGPGTAAEFERLLGETLLGSREPGGFPIRVSELLPAADGLGAALGAPRALLAPVAGALRNS